MSVILSVEDVGVCRKQIKVEVPAPAVEAEKKRVAQEFRRQARIPGFRKGKVPLSVVEQRFEEEIRKEIIDRLVPRYWKQAQAESELEPLAPPSLEEVDLEEDSSLTFAATFEIRPEIVLGNIDSFDLPEVDGEPTEEEIDGAMEDLRRGVAEWVDVDRGAARGDLVVGEIRELGAEGEDREASPVSFELGDPSIWEELTLAVTGQPASSEVELERRQEEDEEPRRYRVRIDSVRERDLPPVDDELAGKVGQFDDVDALRQALTERLRAAKLDEGRRKRETALIDQLRARHPVELPQGIVDREAERMVHGYAENLARQGVDPERAGIDWQQLFGQMRPNAEAQVHARLLIDEVAAKLELAVAEDEFEAALAALAKAQGKSTPAVRHALDGAGRLGELRTQLLRDKTLKALLGDPAEEASADSPTEPEAGEEG